MGVPTCAVLVLLQMAIMMGSSVAVLQGGAAGISNQLPHQSSGYTGEGLDTYRRHRRSLKQDNMDLSPGSSSSQGSSKLSQNEYSPPGVIPTTNVPAQGVPTLLRTEFYTQGPVDAANVQASAPSNDSCMTIGEVLKQIGATKWYELLTDAGLKTVLLDPKNIQTTVLVPVDQAFYKPIDAQPLRQEKTMDELVYYAPEIAKPLAGASVLNGLWPSDSLGTSMRIATSNSIGMEPLHVIVGENKVLQGENGGSTANIIQKDIVACGPSIIHVIDNILLPFSFQDAPKDAITGQ